MSSEVSGPDIAEIVQLFQELKVRTYRNQEDILDIIGSVIEQEYPDSAFFVVDLTTVINQFQRWSACLPQVTPHYAIKCNPNDMLKMFLKIPDSVGFTTCLYNTVCIFGDVQSQLFASE